jgi:hypothetical protein
VDCQIHCATDAALAEAIDRFLPPARPFFAVLPRASGIGWLPPGDPEPPRPIA